MKLLSEYRDNNRTARVYLQGDCFLVDFNGTTQQEYLTENTAEAAAEDWVLSVVDSGVIRALPRGAKRNAD